VSGLTTVQFDILAVLVTVYSLLSITDDADFNTVLLHRYIYKNNFLRKNQRFFLVLAAFVHYVFCLTGDYKLQLCTLLSLTSRTQLIFPFGLFSASHDDIV